MSYLERPGHDQLATVGGYVVKIWVEQEGERDQLKFTLEMFSQVTGQLSSRQWTFSIYLDVGTTVALAQLQLLRDAMANLWFTEVDYYYDEDWDLRHCYYVKVYSLSEAPYPTLMDGPG